MTQVDGCSDQSCLIADKPAVQGFKRVHILEGPAWGDALNVIGSFGDPSGLSENIIPPLQKVNSHLIPRRTQHGPYHSPCGRGCGSGRTNLLGYPPGSRTSPLPCEAPRVP